MLLNRRKIVVIGNDVISLYAITELLADRELRIIPLRQGSGTLDAVKFVRPELILLDGSMPSASGKAIRELLDRDEETRTIPSISCSSSEGGRLPTLAPRYGTGDAGRRF